MAEWLLYGANGYTGRLIAEAAVRRGLRPVLAGRNAAAIKQLADELACPARVFALDDRQALDRAIGNAGTVLLAAGPFSSTSAPVVAGCLRTGARYLDITGEIGVFEACHARADAARERGAVLLPGVGFDVVPTDCLAARLKAILPTATHLELAFASIGSRPSRGTRLTTVDALASGGAVREDGVIRREPLLLRSRQVPFRDRTRPCVAIPWGDVATAYYTTAIPNITVWQAVSPAVFRMRGLARMLVRLARTPAVHTWLRGRAARAAAGPDEGTRQRSSVQLWGIARDSSTGQVVEGTLTTPNGYVLTAATAAECAEQVANGALSAGFYTPALAFGADFIQRFAGCELHVPAHPSSQSGSPAESAPAHRSRRR